MNYAKTKRRAYSRFILRLLAGGSILYVGGLFNPRSSLRIVKAFQNFSSRELVQLRRALRNLERQRLIDIAEKGEGALVRLTKRGAQKASLLPLEEITIPPCATWDQKWRLVLFDIPEYLREGRDALRRTLIRLGFYQTQKSAFLYPYPCEKEIEAIARTFEFERYVHYFIVEIPKPSYHKYLQKHFNLTHRCY